MKKKKKSYVAIVHSSAHYGYLQSGKQGRCFLIGTRMLHFYSSASRVRREIVFSDTIPLRGLVSLYNNSLHPRPLFIRLLRAAEDIRVNFMCR